MRAGFEENEVLIWINFSIKWPFGGFVFNEQQIYTLE